MGPNSSIVTPPYEGIVHWPVAIGVAFVRAGAGMCRSRSNAGSAPLPCLLGLILCTESASSMAPDPRAPRPPGPYGSLYSRVPILCAADAVHPNRSRRFAKSLGGTGSGKLTVQPRSSDHPGRRFFPVLRDKFRITARLEHRLCLRQFWIPIPQCPRDPRQDFDGDRNNTLYKKAFRLGTMVARGWVSRTEVFAALFEAAATCGLNEDDDGSKQTQKTIESGLNGGEKVPHPDLENGDGEQWEEPPADDEDPFVFVGDAPPAPPKELIRDLLYVDGVTILGGQTGAAKRFWRSTRRSVWQKDSHSSATGSSSVSAPHSSSQKAAP
jgi:hypothetical protein